MDYTVIESNDINYISELLIDEQGTLKILSYQELRHVPQEHLSQFCTENGYYIIPTQELIEFIKSEIGDSKALEIGAGSGAVCKALSIRGVDNYMQRQPEIKAYYNALGQAIVPYGDHVERMDGLDAVKKYKPEVVIACYVTHKYNPKEHWREGNQFGIDEVRMLKRINKYIHVGNRKVHGKKPLLSMHHKIIKEDWIVGRSLTKENEIWIWEN